MKTKRGRTAVILLSIFILLSSCSQFPGNPGREKSEPIEASGVIEAHQVNITPELSGIIAEVFVEEGSQVDAGTLLLSLEDELISQERNQAQGGYNAAQAQLESAQAAENAATANLRAAESALEISQITYQQVLSQTQQLPGADRAADWSEVNSFEFDQPAWYFQVPENISAAEKIVEETRDAYQLELEYYQTTAAEISNGDFLAAEQRLAEAQAAFLIAEDLRDRQVSYTGQEEIKDLQNSIYDSAETELEEAQEAFAELLTDPEYDDILEARARVSVAREHFDLAQDHLFKLYSGEYALEVQAARAQISAAEAGVALAQAQLDQARSGRVLAETSLLQAQTALDVANLHLEKVGLFAPISGVITTRTVEPGEFIATGYTALTISDLSELTVTVYLPEDRYGQVDLGDTAELTIDSYPEQIFEGEVIWIAEQAEYTPRNVQTQEERQNTVYAVKLAVQSSSKLKPGMPADVVFQP